MSREQYITETINILKERYNLSLSELIDTYTGETTIPATIYNNKLTPLEATTQYLKEIRKLEEKEIAQTLHRRKSTIQAAYNNAKQKNVTIKEDNQTTHRIPLTAFNKTLSPAETIIHNLNKQGLKNNEIAELLGKDARNIWQQLKRAQEKLKEEKQ
jgi:DNA-directed RNA polymerase specialized sigma24 family protein